MRLKDIGGMFDFSDMVFHFFEHFVDFAGVVGEDFQRFGIDVGEGADGGFVFFKG
jgi:methionine synthase II (cobalamin-independent)